MPETKSIPAAKSPGQKKDAFKDKEKPNEIRMTNISAAKGGAMVDSLSLCLIFQIEGDVVLIFTVLFQLWQTLFVQV
jgi:hypothetical protein